MSETKLVLPLCLLFMGAHNLSLSPLAKNCKVSQGKYETCLAVCSFRDLGALLCVVLGKTCLSYPGAMTLESEEFPSWGLTLHADTRGFPPAATLTPVL